MNCEHVFDRLTRGPFPAGEADDALVERHLLACHECRQLAEALRPALHLFHETLADEAAALPGYRGSISAITAVLPRVAAHAISPPPEENKPAEVTLRAPAMPINLVGTLRIAAVLVLGVALVMWLRAMGVDEYDRGRLAGASHSLSVSADEAKTMKATQPNEAGQLLLASLSLPAACFEIGDDYHSLIPPSEALSFTGEAAQHYRCCTECHARAAGPTAPVVAVATLTRSCQACHQP